MTPAEAAGLVLGKTYVVGDTDDESPVKGTLLRFKKDDRSSVPLFEIVDQLGNVISDHQYEGIHNLVKGPDGKPLAVEDEKEAAPVQINLNGNSTTIVVQRNLTPEQVAAVLKAINS